MQDANATISAYALTRPGKEALLFKSADRANKMLESLNDPTAKVEELRPGNHVFTDNEAVGDLVEFIRKWHKHGIDHLRGMIDDEAAVYPIGDHEFRADDPVGFGIRVGMLVGLHTFENLPIVDLAMAPEGDDE